MWPIQTITLLLCLTDDEQLFAQAIPPVDALPAVECLAPEPNVEEDALTIMVV
ncbi:MAG: hypothetical protein KIT10_02635 [Flavobacteriales bacterium]|nr:hypothetical protein [Flavobacteriales bacterium]